MERMALGWGSVLALACFVIAASGGACSSTAAGAADASTESGDDDTDAAGADHWDPGPTGDDCLGGAAPSKADLDSSGGWNAPPPAGGPSCTDADLATFAANLSASGGPLRGGSYANIANGLSATCASCLVSREGDAKWTSIVTDSAGTKGFLNYGACYARKSGSEACGKAMQYESFCVSITCSGCGTAPSSTCMKDPGTTDLCEANFGADITASCPAADGGEAKALAATCDDILTGARYLCGPAAGDASADAASDAQME